MNTLLLTLMLLSPNETAINKEIEQQTANAVNLIQQENKAQIKAQTNLTLESIKITLPVILDKQTLAKNQTQPKQQNQN